jgi:excisionase family DNA binding protein
MPEHFLTTREAANYLKVSAATVRRWCAAGRLPAFLVGRHWRIARAQMERLAFFAWTLSRIRQDDGGGDEERLTPVPRRG